MKHFLIIFSVLFLISCSKENKTQQIGERFFETYSKRKEVDKILSFYADKIDYENIGFESETDDPKFLYQQFYGWSDAGFKYSSAETIQVDEILSNDSTIIATGTTMPYSYNGKQVEGTRFVICLELDKSLKIKKQTDWFDYPMAEVLEAYYLKNSMKIE